MAGRDRQPLHTAGPRLTIADLPLPAHHRREDVVTARCTHLDQIGDVTPDADGVCPDCVAIGGRWLHLRMCLVCGHVGCCDDSPNRHATGHYRATGHPLIRSLEPGEDWCWCFVDQVAFVVETDA